MRTFLLMLASAFCGGLMTIAMIWGYFAWQYHRAESAPVRFPSRSEETVDQVPPIVEREQFYGSHASWHGEFPRTARHSVLAGGPGQLTGSVRSDGKPLSGLRLRLALNGAVMSQWATSGADGKYEVAVPHGKYKVNGYELDSDSAHRVLSGKVDGPRVHFHENEILTVADGRPAKGLDLEFVEPVKRKGPSGEVSAAKPLVVSWEAYPGAVSYRLQLIEQKAPRDYESQKRLFEWRERPLVTGTSANLTERGVKLKKGHYYSVEIEALGDNRRPLSQTAHDTHLGGGGFTVAD